MKKLITIILALALILPVAAQASESDVVGCWAHYDVQLNGAPAMQMLYLAENHTCFFIIQSFKEDEAWIGRTFVGTWEMQGDDVVYAKTGNNSDTTLKLNTNNTLAVEKDTLHVFVNITPFTLN